MPVARAEVKTKEHAKERERERERRRQNEGNVMHKVGGAVTSKSPLAESAAVPVAAEQSIAELVTVCSSLRIASSWHLRVFVLFCLSDCGCLASSVGQ